MQRGASTKSGLARLRPLTAGHDTPETKDVSKDKLPSGWYYNENKEQDIWKDLEKAKDISTNTTLDEENKRAQNKSQMSEASSKIVNLIDKFDELDREAIFQIQKISDENISIDEISLEDLPNMFSNQKSSVIQFMNELNQVGETQTQLLESLKNAFYQIRGNTSFLTDESKSHEAAPDPHVFLDSLEQIFAENIERAEKASAIHHDVTHFWMKHVTDFKKVITKRDLDIVKLKETNQELQKEISARNSRKKQEKLEADELKQNMKILENTVKQLEQARSQITQLKAQLQESEQQRASQALHRVPSISSYEKSQNLEREAEALNKQLEFEAKCKNLEDRLNQLDKDLRKSRLETEEEKGNSALLQKQIDDLNQQLLQSQADTKKYINLLEVEQSKPKTADPDSPKKDSALAESERENYLTQIMKLKDDLKDQLIKARQALDDQAAMLRQKYANERTKLIDQLQAKDKAIDNSNLLKSIIDEYEKKLAEQKQKYDENMETMIRSWSGKLSLEQRQFQNRIRIINQNHETEIINTQQSIDYEISKMRVEMDDQYQKKLLEETKKYSDDMKNLESENAKLQTRVKEQDLELGNLRARYGLEANDDDKQKNTFTTIIPRADPAELKRLMEQYNQKVKTLKEDLESQSEWALTKQKNFYENKIDTMTVKNQIDLRRVLLKVQESIAKIVAEGEDSITLAQALDSISNTVQKMNDQLEEADAENVELVSLNDANERMRLLTENITKLKNERDDLLQKIGMDSTGAEELETLRNRIKYYESLQKGDQLAQAKAMKELEDNLRSEIQVKDALIEHYKAEMELRGSFMGNKYSEVIVSIKPTKRKSAIVKQVPRLKIENIEETPKQKQEVQNPVLTIQDPDKPTQQVIQQEQQQQQKEEEKPTTKLEIQIPVETVDEKVDEKPPIEIVEPSTTVVTENNEENQQEKAEEQQQNVEEQVEEEEEEDAFEFEPAAVDSEPITLKSHSFSLMRSTPQFIFSGASLQKQPTVLEPSQTFEMFNLNSTDDLPKVDNVLRPVTLHLEELQNVHHEMKQSTPLSLSKNIEVSPTRSTPCLPQLAGGKVVVKAHPTLKMPYIKSDQEKADSKTSSAAQSPKTSSRTLTVKTVARASDLVDAPIVNGRAQISISPSVSLERSIFRQIDRVPRFTLQLMQVFSEAPDATDHWKKPEITYINNPVFIQKSSRSSRSEHPVEEEESSSEETVFIKSQRSRRSLKIEPKPQLYISDSFHFGVMQRLVSMTQQAAARIIRYNGDRDISTFESYFIPGIAVHLSIVPSHIHDDAYDRFMEINMQYSKIDPELIAERERHAKEILTRDNQIISFKNENEQLTSQLKKLEAAYRISLQNENRLAKERELSQTSLLEKQRAQTETNFAIQKQEDHKEEKTPEKPPKEEKPPRDPNQRANVTKIDVDLSESNEVDDPFTKSIQLMAANMRFINEYRKNEEEIGETLRSDCSAYESFMMATGTVNDAQTSFISQMKESYKNIQKNTDQLDEFNLLQHQLLTVLRQSKKKAQTLSNDSMNAAKAILQQEIDRSQRELQSLYQSGQEKSDQLTVIEKIRTALEMVNTLEVGLTDSDSQQYHKLNKQIDIIENQIKADEKVPQETIDNIRIQVQNLIAGIKPVLARASSPVTIESSTDSPELKEKISRMNRELNEAKSQLESEQAKNMTLTQNYAKLKNRLDEERETNSSTIQMYQTQIATLKELLHHVENTSSPADTVTAIRSEIITLQSMVDAMRADRDIQKSKCNELEDQLAAKEEAMRADTERYENLLAEKESLEKQVRKQDEQALFHESDLETMKAEKLANEQLGMKNRLQLEEAIGNNEKLLTKIQDLENTIRTQKKEIQTSKDEIEDLQIKLSFGYFYRSKVPHTMVGTQTTFKLVRRRREEPKVEEQKPVEEVKEETPAVNPPETKPVEEEPKEEKVEVIKEEPKVEEHFVTPTQTNNNTPVSEENSDRIELGDESDDYSLYNSKEEWVDMSNEEDKDEFSAEILPSHQETDLVNIKDFGNQAVQKVHDPLWQRKSRTKLPQVIEPKKNQTKPKQRPTTSVSRTTVNLDNSKLAIGDAGKDHQKGSPSQIHRYRPTIKPFTKSPMINCKPPVLEPIVDNIKFGQQTPQTMPTSPKGSSPPPLTNYRRVPVPVIHTVVQQKSSPGSFIDDDSEAVKITRIQYELPKTTVNSPRLPIVMPVQREVWSDKKKSQQEPEEHGNLSEIQSIIARLREKNARQQQEIDDKDKIIDELNMRLADLQKELQRAKLDVLRSDETTRKTTIKYDSLRQRFDIALQELDQRNDEASAMRKEIDRLKRAAKPATTGLGRIKNAQAEMQRITNEQRRKKMMLDKAKSALENSTDPKLSTHLSGILQNTQKSLSRLEANRRMWKEIETKQLMSVLGALSLVDENPTDILKNLRLPVVRPRLRPRVHMHTSEASIDLSHKSDEKPINYPFTYEKTLEVLDEEGITEDEKKAAIRGVLSPNVADKIKAANERAHLTDAVVTPSNA